DGVLDQPFFLVHFDTGQGSGAGHHVRTVRPADPEWARLIVIADLFAGDHRAEWHIPGGQALRHGQDVRLHTWIIVNSEPFARSPEAAHHFVHDQEDAILVADPAHNIPIFGIRWGDQTAGSAVTFQHDRGDSLWPFEFDHLLDVISAHQIARILIFAEHAAVAIRIVEMNHPRDARLIRYPARIATRLLRAEALS